MRRIPSLTGFIIGTVMTAVYTGFELFTFALIIDLIFGLDAQAGVSLAMIVMLLTLALSIVTLVLNACSINCWKKSPEGYKKKKGTIIASIVFNFIVVLLIIIGMAMNTEGNSFGVLDILMIIALVATNILAFVDLGMEKKRAETYNATEATEELVEPKQVETEE